MKKTFLECGKVVTTHGIKGELKVMPWCDEPEFLEGFKTLYLDGGRESIQVESCRAQNNMALIKFVGLDSIESAIALRGKVLYINRQDTAMDEGDCFIQDLIGIHVVDVDTGIEYGTISDVSQTGANDVYHILFADGKERLIPAIKDVIISVDLDGELMKIRPLKGLFDDED